VSAHERSRIEPLLTEIARNYRWGWHRPSRRLVEQVRRVAGALADAHPLVAMETLGDTDWTRLLAVPGFCDDVRAAHASLTEELAGAAPRVTAYFSPEFGINEALPQYSGGLGILAGDHLKAASDADLPLVGVGLFYREGFFRQLVVDAHQSERYQTQHPALLGAVDTDVVVEVPLGEITAHCRVWRMDIGRIPLYLLDTDVSPNTAAVRSITDRLYSGDQEHRLRQELVLGVGGARALAALGITPTCFHLNEGHAGLLVLELIERAYRAGARSITEALEQIRPVTLFTTHTPVPAGIDRFPRPLFARYVEPWAIANGIPFDELLELGILPSDGPDTPFNMAAFCLSAAGRANGVSALHGAVSREMFAALPLGPSISSVTNGVHARTWVSDHVQDLFDADLGPGWDTGDPAAWARAESLAPASVRAAWQPGRERLVDLVARAAHTKLDPQALTIGFARRFATYKRAGLLLTNLERVRALLADDERPVQFVFAGKAHPADADGKALLTIVNRFAASRDANHRFVFVPDYDIDVARTLYGGCDVWLNNPVRPMEACGTSGEKAALNGALNCSVRDGWWDEMSDGRNGWDIPTSDLHGHARDLEEAEALYDLLETDIVPLFYGTGDGRASDAWIARVRHAWVTLGPQVVAARMVRDYDQRYYRP
jgi:starch phosphorylase